MSEMSSPKTVIKVIEKSIEGGFDFEKWWDDLENSEVYLLIQADLPWTLEVRVTWLMQTDFIQVLFCNPLFFQALGKALELKCPKEGHKAEYCGSAWKFYAHQYFDLVLTGGDTKKFWKELLTTNK